MLRIALRMVPLFGAIVGLALLLGTYMNFSIVRASYIDTIRARMAVLVEQIRTTVETAQSLGIAVPEQTTLEGLLAREARDVPLLLSLDVVSADGRVFYSSDAARMGIAADPAAAEPGVLVEPAAVRNDFGEVVAWVRLRYDEAPIRAEVAQLAGRILSASLPTGLAAIALSCLGALLLVQRIRAQSSAFLDPMESLPAARDASHEVARIHEAVERRLRSDLPAG